MLKNSQVSQNKDIYIREFKNSDRKDIRRISCQTAFLGIPYTEIFDDKEILADVLTLYFTNYEPKSCFVTISKNKVIGYIIGSKDVKLMRRVFISKLLPKLFVKILFRNVLFKRNTRTFLMGIITSIMRGEFFNPDFSKQYPATLHINIDENYRGLNIGKNLVNYYLDFLKGKNIHGIHISTMSEGAKMFFTKLGFTLLFEGKFSHLHNYLKRKVPHYILGKKF